MREFHAAHADVGVELEVARRPYSFHGGTPAERNTWKWRTGLSVYCGDQIVNQLVPAGLLTPEQGQLLRTDPPAALSDPKVRTAIQLLAQHTGQPAPDFERIVELHRRGRDFGWARGRKVSAFDHVCGERAVAGLSQLGKSGRAKPIGFRFDVDFAWHPVESQRSLIWAGRQGKQEELVDVLARKHFEEATSVNHRATLLDAAKEVGLDADALAAFLDTDEEEAAVWRSYRDTTEKHDIHSIPYFVFNGVGSNGGPFRGNGSGGHTVRGSASVDEYFAIFERLLEEDTARATRTPATRTAQTPSAAAKRIEAALGGDAAPFKPQGAASLKPQGGGRTKGAAKPAGMKKGFLLG